MDARGGTGWLRGRVATGKVITAEDDQGVGVVCQQPLSARGVLSAAACASMGSTARSRDGAQDTVGPDERYKASSSGSLHGSFAHPAEDGQALSHRQVRRSAGSN